MTLTPSQKTLELLKMMECNQGKLSFINSSVNVPELVELYRSLNNGEIVDDVRDYSQISEHFLKTKIASHVSLTSHELWDLFNYEKNPTLKKQLLESYIEKHNNILNPKLALQIFNHQYIPIRYTLKSWLKISWFFLGIGLVAGLLAGSFIIPVVIYLAIRILWHLSEGSLNYEVNKTIANSLFIGGLTFVFSISLPLLLPGAILFGLWYGTNHYLLDYYYELKNKPRPEQEPIYPYDNQLDD